MMEIENKRVEQVLSTLGAGFLAKNGISSISEIVGLNADSVINLLAKMEKELSEVPDYYIRTAHLREFQGAFLAIWHILN